MTYYHFKNNEENKDFAEILQEAHERIYQNYMKQQEKEKLRAWIEEEIQKQALKELEKTLKDIFK